MKRIILAFGALSISLAPALACDAEHATYRHLEDKSFTISFSKQKHPKAWSNIQATLKTPARKLDFEFTASNGYEVLSMVLLTKGIEQSRDISINFLDKNLKSLHLPEAGKPAAEFLVAPELGVWLYYSGLDPQDYIPPGVWKLDTCR